MDLLETLTSDGSPVKPPSLESLAEAIAELQRQVDLLLAAAQDRYREPEECRQHRCSYYQHYLAFGPPELSHDGYHAAEKRCLEVQNEYERWLLAHEGREDKAREKLCSYWERKVRA